MIQLAHVRNKEVAGLKVYCGRAHAGYPQSPLHNPNPAIKGKPGATLPAYLEHLRAEYKKQGEVYAMLNRLADLHKRGRRIVLQCWCEDTSTCHCTVIAKAIVGIADN